MTDIIGNIVLHKSLNTKSSVNGLTPLPGVTIHQSSSTNFEVVTNIEPKTPCPTSSVLTMIWAQILKTPGFAMSMD